MSILSNRSKFIVAIGVLAFLMSNVTPFIATDGTRFEETLSWLRSLDLNRHVILLKTRDCSPVPEFYTRGNKQVTSARVYKYPWRYLRETLYSLDVADIDIAGSYHFINDKNKNAGCVVPYIGKLSPFFNVTILRGLTFPGIPEDN